MLTVLDLFSGIGGFSLGLENTGGFKTVAFCEIDSYCRRVLAKHWPEVPCFDDVRLLTGDAIGYVDLICGGFPCQDISTAGKGAGLDGERSGLWFQFERLIGEIRPAYVLIENVPALRSRGLDRVLGGFAALGYDARWHCLPAAALGAPHRRDRLWIVANAARFQPGRQEQRPERQRTGQCGESVAMANADSDARPQRAASFRDGWWLAEPDVGRVAHGVPARVDRLRGLGNAIVPQIAEILGLAILKDASVHLRQT